MVGELARNHCTKVREVMNARVAEDLPGQWYRKLLLDGDIANKTLVGLTVWRIENPLKNSPGTKANVSLD